MANHKRNTATSLQRQDEALTMAVEVGVRWACDCGQAGPWMRRTLRNRQFGQSIPDGAVGSEMSSLVEAWEKHLAQHHPDADLTFDEWADDDGKEEG